jgi:squalene-hopene/tetraprenyl-beta-curcumene cyclase
VDLTAHAIRALRLAESRAEHSGEPDAGRSPESNAGIDRAIRDGLRFLEKKRQPDGTWLPLWFGNQDRVEEDNPVYGTSKVLVDFHPNLAGDAIESGVDGLVRFQNPDGGWGGGPSVASEFALEGEQDADQTSTVEETALAVEALASLPESRLTNRVRDAILSGSGWLVRAIADDRHQAAWPIGFYFAKLWYFERLYPTIFALAALARVDALPTLHSAASNAAHPPTAPHHDETS